MSEWDKWYYDLCQTVAKNSKCLSRKIGAIIIRDKRIISTGYNGPPEGVQSCGLRHHVDPKYREILAAKKIEPDETRCPRYVLGFKSGEGLDWCVAGHAERNSLISAARMGIETKGGVMYMDCPTPCTPCLVEIINAGITEIVITKHSYYDVSAEYLVNNSNLKVRVYDFMEGNE